MDVPVELLVDDVWSSENDKPYFLSLGVDSFELIIFEKTTNFLSHDTNIYKNKREPDKWG